MYSMIYATAGSEEDAVKLARHLLRKRLVACANIFPVRSVYRWRGKVKEEGEFVLVMKTRSDRVRGAIKEAAKIHPYEVPCLVSYEMGEALSSYLRWIDGETRGRGR